MVKVGYEINGRKYYSEIIFEELKSQLTALQSELDEVITEGNGMKEALKRVNKELEQVKKERDNVIAYYETFHPIEEWREDYGCVLWWRFPIEEPPYCGTPNDTDFYPDNGEPCFTHFTRVICNSALAESQQQTNGEG